MQKSPLQYGKIIFQSKVIPLFLPKCSKFHHSECILYMEYTIPYNMGNTVDFLRYMVENVGGGGGDGKWRNEVDTKTVKIATSEINFSILKRNFTIL